MISKLNRFVEPVEPDIVPDTVPEKVEVPAPPVEEQYVAPKVSDVQMAANVMLQDLTWSEVQDAIQSRAAKLACEDKNCIRAFAGTQQARQHEYVQRMRSDYLMAQVEEEAARKEQYRHQVEAKKEEILERLARFELDTGTPFFEWNHSAAPQLAVSEGKGVTPADVAVEMVEEDKDAIRRDLDEFPPKGNLDVTVEPVIISMPTLEGKGKDVRTGEIIATLTYKGDAILVGTFHENTENVIVNVMPGIESFLLRMIAVPSIMAGKSHEANSIWNTTVSTMRALLQNARQSPAALMQTLSQLLLLESSENRIKADLVRGAAQ